jgi:carboxylesterase 2
MEIRIFRCLLAVQLLVLVACEDPAGRNLNDRTVVRTDSGMVRGVVKQTVMGRDYLSFQGIPYMKPPLGKLRFKAPEPPVKWSNILDATKEIPGYTQLHSFHQKIWGQENAGVINVYTPAIYWINLLPVLVWIHGGSFKVR